MTGAGARQLGPGPLVAPGVARPGPGGALTALLALGAPSPVALTHRHVLVGIVLLVCSLTDK